MSSRTTVQSYTCEATTRLGASDAWSDWVPNQSTLPASFAAPIEPTTDCDEPVRTSAPAVMWALAASVIAATSENEPVHVLDRVTEGSVAATPCVNPSM